MTGVVKLTKQNLGFRLLSYIPDFEGAKVQNFPEIKVFENEPDNNGILEHTYALALKCARPGS